MWGGEEEGEEYEKIRGGERERRGAGEGRRRVGA